MGAGGDLHFAAGQKQVETFDRVREKNPAVAGRKTRWEDGGTAGAMTRRRFVGKAPSSAEVRRRPGPPGHIPGGGASHQTLARTFSRNRRLARALAIVAAGVSPTWQHSTITGPLNPTALSFRKTAVKSTLPVPN